MKKASDATVREWMQRSCTDGRAWTKPIALECSILLSRSPRPMEIACIFYTHTNWFPLTSNLTCSKLVIVRLQYPSQLSSYTELAYSYRLRQHNKGCWPTLLFTTILNIWTALFLDTKCPPLSFLFAGLPQRLSLIHIWRCRRRG